MLSLLGFKNLSWKTILAVLSAILILCTVIAGYVYVDRLKKDALRLQSQVETLQGQVNMARFERNIAEARAKEFVDAQAEMSARLLTYQNIRSEAEAELRELRAELLKFDLEKEIDHDAAAARDRLNARTRELNRVLERASKF
jgi:outer membrane murein-binding lipoprotein Lpp